MLRSYAAMKFILTTRKSLGFTLVELLVVISIIAVIGTAALVAINPVELRARARDQARLQDAKTLQQAVLRYYSGENCYPWQYLTNSTTCVRNKSLTAAYIVPSSFTAGDYNFSALITKQELKPLFSGRPSVVNSEFFVSWSTAKSRFSVCFNPESKAGRSGAIGKNMNITNLAAMNCKTSYSIDQTDCHICVPQL